MHSIMRKGRLPAISKESLEQLLCVAPEQHQAAELPEGQQHTEVDEREQKTATAPLVLMWNTDRQILHGMYCARYVMQ
jgi:hypothetical protein